MKKYRFLSLLLSLVLLFSLLTAAVYGVAETTAEQPASTQETQETVPTQETEAVDSSETQEAADIFVPTAGKAAGVRLEPNSQLLAESSVLSAAPEHTVDAKAALLLELNSNTIVLDYKAKERVYPASLTKIMTCMLVLDYGSLNDTVTVTSSALSGLDEEGSTAGLCEGEQLSVHDLLYCMMLSSANEACNIAAEYICGNVKDFVSLMNQKAAALGCSDTHFANTHGLHNDNHYTTAYDLSLIVRKALENETFREITSTTSYTVPATNKSDARNLTTTNFLISTATVSDYYYPNASGVKTGFTSTAGRCLISTASDGNLRFLSILLGAQTRVNEDGSVVYDNFVETADLFDYGFDSFAYAQVLSKLQPTAQVPVALSAGASSVVLIPSEDISCLLPKEYDSTLITTVTALDNPDGLTAPLEAGQKVGTISVFYKGSALGKTTLETLTAIEKSQAAETFEKTKSFAQTYWWLILLLVVVVILLVLVLLVLSSMRRRRRHEQMRKRRPGGETQ